MSVLVSCQKLWMTFQAVSSDSAFEAVLHCKIAMVLFLSLFLSRMSLAGQWWSLSFWRHGVEILLGVGPIWFHVEEMDGSVSGIHLTTHCWQSFWHINSVSGFFFLKTFLRCPFIAGKDVLLGQHWLQNNFNWQSLALPFLWQPWSKLLFLILFTWNIWWSWASEVYHRRREGSCICKKSRKTMIIAFIVFTKSVVLIRLLTVWMYVGCSEEVRSAIWY